MDGLAQQLLILSEESLKVTVVLNIFQYGQDLLLLTNFVFMSHLSRNSMFLPVPSHSFAILSGLIEVLFVAFGLSELFSGFNNLLVVSHRPCPLVLLPNLLLSQLLFVQPHVLFKSTWRGLGLVLRSHLVLLSTLVGF